MYPAQTAQYPQQPQYPQQQQYPPPYNSDGSGYPPQAPAGFYPPPNQGYYPQQTAQGVYYTGDPNYGGQPVVAQPQPAVIHQTTYHTTQESSNSKTDDLCCFCCGAACFACLFSLCCSD